MGVERNQASWISVAPLHKDPRYPRRGGRLSPRCSCPYAGTTRIRFEGLPRIRRPLSPLSGHPLDAAIIRRVRPCRQGCKRRATFWSARVKKVWLSGAPDCPVSTGQRLSAPPLTPVFAGNLQVLTFFSTITLLHDNPDPSNCCS